MYSGSSHNESKNFETKFEGVIRKSEKSRDGLILTGLK